MSINRVGENWGENTITWDNDRPRVYEFEYAIATPSYSENWVKFDITQLVKEWINGVYSNYGIMVSYASYSHPEKYDFHFYSSDYNAYPSKRPKLTIVYDN